MPYKDKAIAKRVTRIANWKARGMIDDDFDDLYEYMLNETHCMVCLKEYKNTKDRHVDHDHDIKDEPNVRYICCNICNTTFLKEIPSVTNCRNILYHKANDKYYYRIQKDGVRHYSPYFNTKEEALQYENNYTS
tara:strand:+ start:85 stop:486 length:402 start_codon:yes stop_codon:yes gene_type:complete